MRKMWPAVALLAAFTAACGSGGDNADLVQSRYGDCLNHLHADLDQALDHFVSYTTDAGYLTFRVGTFRGRTLTVPDQPRDIEILGTVGC